MKSFLGKFSHVVRGVLNGFDRLFFRGTLRNLSYEFGLQNYLWATGVKFKDFHQHSLAVTKQLEEASLRQAQETGRPIRYLNSSQVRTEDEARQIAAKDGIANGLICVLRRVDPCMSFQINKNRDTRKLQITYRRRQCLHLYHYQIHPIFGFMHARIQTWFPFHVYVCINGREWLARQLDQAGLHYQRYDNCFTDLEDVAKAQALFDQQLQANWRSLLDELAHSLNPLHDTLFAQYPTQYYWSVAQSEWASDVMFRSRADLQALYARWLRYAITTYGPADVLRFLGRKLPEGSTNVPARFSGTVESGLKARAEGVRIKHWLNHNSIKLYDKSSVLRCECTINDPKDFRVFRTKEGDTSGEKAWLPMRYGTADMHRRAVVSQAADERYLEALAAVSDATPLRELAEPLCRPAVAPRKTRPTTTAPAQAPAAEPAKPMTTAAASPSAEETSSGDSTSRTVDKPSKRRRVRALNPFATEDATLLYAVSRPEFLINGLRNRDLRGLLYTSAAKDKAEERRRSAAVGRKLRMLRAHGLIQKVPQAHRYVVSDKGRTSITALLAARSANTDLLTTNAA